jgi:hypothetical protein
MPIFLVAFALPFLIKNADEMSIQTLAFGKTHTIFSKAIKKASLQQRLTSGRAISKASLPFLMIFTRRPQR